VRLGRRFLEPRPDPLASTMTRIDFYSNAEPKLQVACRLVARIVQQGLRVFVYAPDENTARTFDNLLRTYQAVPSCAVITHFLPKSGRHSIRRCRDHASRDHD